MSEALKPCPFCGGKPYALAAGQSSTGINMVRCDYCGARMLGHDIPKAIETWNRRAPATLPTVEELRELFWRQEGVHLNLHHAIFLATITLEYLTRRMGGES